MRVAVTAPILLGTPDSSLAGVGTATALTGVLDALSNLREVAALDASELKGVSSPWQAARALAADEWVAVSLAPHGEDWEVALRRLSVRDSSVRWAAVRDSGLDGRKSRFRLHGNGMIAQTVKREGRITAAIRSSDWNGLIS